MKCPKCNLEIDENVMYCPMCQTQLLEQINESIEEEGKTAESALLMTAENDLQANIVESLLKVYGIPLRRAYKGNDTFGKIILGLTVNGIDLYVPKSSLEEAKDIIKNELPEGEAEAEQIEETEELEVLAEKFEKKRRTRAWIIIIVLLPGVLGLAIAVINWLIRLLLQ